MASRFKPASRERTIASVIAAGRAKLGITQAEFARRAGVTTTSVRKWEDGDAAPSRSRQAMVAGLLGISLPELMCLTDVAQVVLPDGTQHDQPIYRDSHVANDDATVRIPQHSTGGAMGNGVVLQDQPGLIRSLSVSRNWVLKNVRNYSALSNLAIVTGFGDSMRPMFEPGDPLLIDIGIRRVDHDGVYFFRVGDEGFIKRLQRVPGTGLIAISANTHYRDWIITDAMDFEVFGRVIKAWRGQDY
jgi:phage repressor protein C with HTH and peptisase S24 domain